MAIVNMNVIPLSVDFEYSETVATGSTGRQSNDILIPNSAQTVKVVYRGLSTASVQVAVTSSTLAEIKAGTAVWANVGTASTGGTVQTLDLPCPPNAVALNVGTGLAGNQGYIAVVATGQK